MQDCTIWGDMSSDKSSENYPEVQICDECVSKWDGEEDSPIVHVNGPNDDKDTICHLCEKTRADELKEAKD